MLLQAERIGDLGRDLLHGGAKVTPNDSSLVSQLWQQLFDGIGRNCKADTDIAARLTEDRRIDANHFTAQIDQGTARVTWIDRSVGLDEVVVRSGTDLPTFGADNAGGHGMVETKGIADRHDPLADFQTIRVAEGDGREILSGVNFDHSDIGFLVLADNLGVVSFPVR